MKKNRFIFVLVVLLLPSLLFLPVQATGGNTGDIKEVMIGNTYWVGDQIPGLTGIKNNSFLLEMQFAEGIPSDAQVHNFIMNAGDHFQLKAKGEKSLTAYAYAHSFYSVENKNTYYLWVYIDSKVRIAIKPDVSYELLPKKPNKDYRWVIKDRIRFRNLSEVEFNFNVNPSTEILTGGKPIGTETKSIVPFSLINGLIIVNARINNSGKEYHLAVDTGAASIVLDNKTADELGLETKVEGKASDYNGAGAVDFVSLKKLSVGEMGVEDCGAIVMSLKVLKGYNIDGLIGYHFLKFFNLELDYEQHSLTLALEKIPLNPSTYKIKLHYKPQTMQITSELIIGDSRVEVIIDSGSLGDTYVLIPRKFADQNPSIFDCKPVKVKGSSNVGAFSQSAGFISRVNLIQLGDFQAKDLPVNCADSSSFVIGSEFLSHFKVTFDFPNMEMFLTPIAGQKMSTNVFNYGFMMQEDDNGKISITGILEGSPADLAGLKVGDEIKKIYDTQGKEWTYADYLIESKNSRTIKLLVKNDHEEREIVLKKAMLLPEQMN